jgi:hypothetical protein
MYTFGHRPLRPRPRRGLIKRTFRVILNFQAGNGNAGGTCGTEVLPLCASFKKRSALFPPTGVGTYNPRAGLKIKDFGFRRQIYQMGGTIQNHV